MSENLSENAPNDTAPENSEILTPRVAPPQGERMARGAWSDESDESDDEALAQWDEIEAIEAESQVEDSYFPTNEEIQAELNGSAVPPSINGGAPIPSPDDADEPEPKSEGRDRELGLIEHLSELRTRMLYCVVAVGLAMCVTWKYGLELQEWFARPIRQVLVSNSVPGSSKGELISTDPTGFFAIYMQVSLVSALIITMPFLMFQVWRFIEPALTNQERRYGLVMTPFSVILFFMGAGLGYVVSPLFFQFFIAFQPSGVAANWDYGQSVVLMAKMLLVFGLCFQVPVVTIFLNKIGLLTRNWMIEYWRHVVVVIFTIVAIITPTWDPLTLTICATPPCLLYALSIWLVKWL